MAIHLGGGEILHHFIGQLSTKLTYSGPWRNRTLAVIRHKDVVVKQDDRPLVDLMDLVPEHLKRRPTVAPA